MKNLKDLFPDIDTCKQFQEMGLFKGSIFVWSRVYGDIRPVIRKDLPRLEEDNWLYCCPTTDEILAVLPNMLKKKYELFVRKDSEGFDVGYEDSYSNEDEVTYDTEYFISNISLPQALSKLFLKLKSENIV